GGARIGGGDDAGADGDGGVLGPGHLQQGPDTHHHSQGGDDDGERGIAQAGFDQPVHGHFTSLVGWVPMPSRMFCWPAATMVSSPASPERICTRVPSTAPTSTRLL